MNDPRVEELFHEALELADPAGRTAFLESRCGTDARLRAAVEAMLADHERAGELLRRTAAGFTLAEGIDDAAARDADIGAMIGPYRIERALGEGGGGMVYEAGQEQPVRRRVALKILKLGMDTRRVIARFEAERQTLALMEHPNIAHVIDAGATATGRPYFVMELVHGARITDYCAQNDLPLPARLELMRQVCAAVQHAHQKGIIHRDLKPANILVALIDGRPVPKVIDFGIAKATAAGPATGDAAFTMVDQVIGTPAYMSPEQIRGGAADVDTRSDIYSLGVILYELLAGRPPFDNDELLRAGIDEMRRRLLHEEPPPPSRLRGAPDGQTTRGELDWIVLKAMEKDRERRYQTVRGLSEDLKRHLAHEPVAAHPPSRWYRLQKLVRRNRLASAATAVAALTLAGGFTTSTLLFLRAQAAERQQARLRAEAEEREHVTKAAIFLMQGKVAEAHAEIEHMGGVLTQPSVEASNVFRSLAVWSALSGDWTTAAKRLLALSRVNRFDDSDMTDNATRDLLAVAPTLITAGDLDAYRGFKRLLIERLGSTHNPVAAEHVLKSCLLLPPGRSTLAALEPAATVAEQSLAAPGADPLTDRLDAWRCAVLGLWHQRNGRQEAAVRWSDRALSLQDGEQARHAYSRLVRAMALGNLGRAGESRADLETARALIEPRFAGPMQFEDGGYWNDWLSARILLHEADQPPAPPATEGRGA